MVAGLPQAPCLQLRESDVVPSCCLRELMCRKRAHVSRNPGNHNGRGPCTHRPSSAAGWKCRQTGDALRDGRRSEHVERLAWGREDRRTLSPRGSVRVSSRCHHHSPPPSWASGREPGGGVANASRAAAEAALNKRAVSK